MPILAGVPGTEDDDRQVQPSGQTCDLRYSGTSLSQWDVRKPLGPLDVPDGGPEIVLSGRCSRQ